MRSVRQMLTNRLKEEGNYFLDDGVMSIKAPVTILNSRPVPCGWRIIMSKQVREVSNTMPRDSSDSRSFKPKQRDVPSSKKAVVQTPSASADRSPEWPPGTNVEFERRSDERAFGVQTGPRTDAGRGLMRVEEAARWLGLGRTKAWELVYSGTLHSVTIGRSRRVPISSLHAFVERLVEHGSA